MRTTPLLHPELIQQTPIVGEISISRMLKRIREAQDDLLFKDGNGNAKARKVSAVIRTLNEQEALYRLLEDLQKQQRVEELELIVVDNESSDKTVRVANYFDAIVRNIPRGEFTYPKSMNIGVDAASHDTVFLTVGHTLMSSPFSLAGAARHFDKDSTGGVFARPLLGPNSSHTERLLQAGALAYLQPAHKVKKAGMGVLGATNCMISKEVWCDLGGFDEAYAMGGEDGDIAKKMLSEGFDIIEDPIITVHHSHGLGPINYARQVRRWMRSANPHAIDLPALAKSRPDRSFS